MGTILIDEELTRRLNSWSKVTQVIYNKYSSPYLSNPKPTIFLLHNIVSRSNRNYLTRRKCLIKYNATKRRIVYIKIYKLTAWIINSVFRTLTWYLYFFYVSNQLTRIIKGTMAILLRLESSYDLLKMLLSLLYALYTWYNR